MHSADDTFEMEVLTAPAGRLSQWEHARVAAARNRANHEKLNRQQGFGRPKGCMKTSPFRRTEGLTSSRVRKKIEIATWEFALQVSERGLTFLKQRVCVCICF